MRVLSFGVAMLASACGLYFGDTSRNRDDASMSTPASDASWLPPDAFSCTAMCGAAPACGNDQLDYCNWHDTSIRCFLEACDGTTVPTCTDVGFYSGSSECAANCRSVRTGNCEACAPNSMCGTFSFFDIDDIAVSGTRTALADEFELVVFDGTTEIKRTPTQVVIRALAGVADGWLVAMDGSPRTIAKLGLDGTLGAPVNLPAGVGYNMALAGGPPNRALLAWVYNVQQTYEVHFTILNTNGVSVGPTRMLFSSVQYPTVSATSDGTSFFVAVTGSLARVSVNGTFTISSAFPPGPQRGVTWSGTHGWFLGHGAAQRFDNTGSKVGASLPYYGTDHAALGEDLITLAHDHMTSRLTIFRNDPTGALVGTPTEVGASDTNRHLVARLGSQVVVAWTNSERVHVALVTP